MSTLIPHEDTPILVDFSLSSGTYEVSRLSPQDRFQKSAEAVDKAMDTIRQMAHRVVSTMQTMPKGPSQVEVEFGIVLSVEAGALISKAGMDATINVKLTFESEKSK